MTIDSVIDQADRLVRRAGTRNVYELCSFLHIKICRMDMQQKIKAYYFYSSRCQRIVIDSNICELFVPVLIGHELAHAVLHREQAAVKGFSFQELEILEKRVRCDAEFEANIFAAELLLPDKEVLEALQQYTFFETAGLLNVPAALLDFKFRCLQHKNYPILAFDCARADFLKKDCGAYSPHSYTL